MTLICLPLVVADSKLAMASDPVADHDTSKKTFVLSPFSFYASLSEFGTVCIVFDSWCVLSFFFCLPVVWLELEAVSGKRVAVVGAGVR